MVLLRFGNEIKEEIPIILFQLSQNTLLWYRLLHLSTFKQLLTLKTIEKTSKQEQILHLRAFYEQERPCMRYVIRKWSLSDPVKNVMRAPLCDNDGKRKISYSPFKRKNYVDTKEPGKGPKHSRIHTTLKSQSSVNIVPNTNSDTRNRSNCLFYSENISKTTHSFI